MANLLLVMGPAFQIAIGFLDPGNWATLMEGGSRFGFELLWVVVFSTLLASVLQTFSGRLGVVTGKHLAQVCREEYPRGICMLLWLFCEISIISLDLTMVLGTAVGLKFVLRVPMLPSLAVMAIDSLLFVVILPLMEMRRAEVIATVVVGIVLLCFLLERLFFSPFPLSTVVGLLPTLRHETLYTAISLVGAIVMPHSFYLHSALVKGRGQSNQSLSNLSHYNFVGTLFAFGALLVVNLAVYIAAVTGFHNAGLVVLTLQDAQALAEQILSNSFSPAIFGLALLCARQLSTMNGSTAGQVVSETFLDLKVRPWQHQVWIRGIALVPAAACVWRYGDEGTYQMLIFLQVLLAFHLPFTVVPLIKLTSSERIMGSHRNSVLLEILAWLSITLVSVASVTLVFGFMFGESEDSPSFSGLEYFAGFQWLIETGVGDLQTAFFATISLGASLALGFLIWLVFTPLQMDTQLSARSSWVEDCKRQEATEFVQLGLQNKSIVPFNYLPEIHLGENEKTLAVHTGQSLSVVSSLGDSPEGLPLEADEVADGNSLGKPLIVVDVLPLLHVDSCDDILSLDPITSPSSSSVLDSFVSSPESTTSCSGMREPIVEEMPEDREALALKKAEAEADADVELLGKDDDDMDLWESLQQDDVIVDALVSNVNGSTNSHHFEGPESGRSVRSDASMVSESENGSGSLSRFPGLGRAARRQFALILNDFWGSLFDLHGNRYPPPQLRSSSPGSRGRHVDGSSNGLSSSQAGDDGERCHPKQQSSSGNKLYNANSRTHNMEAHVLRSQTHAGASTSSYLAQVRSQDYGVFPANKIERKYSSLHMPTYREESDYQPATIHGYRTPSFPGRTNSVPAGPEARPFHLYMSTFGSQPSPGRTHQDLQQGYCNTSDSSSRPLPNSQWEGKNVSHRSSNDTNADRLLSQTEKHFGASETSSYDSSRWGPLYHSRNSASPAWNSLVYRATGELDMNNSLGNSQELKRRVSFSHSPIGRSGEIDRFARSPLVFDEVSPSQSYRNGFSIQDSTSHSETQSLWSRQPFEQLFGATDVPGVASQSLGPASSGSHQARPSTSGIFLVSGVNVDGEVLENIKVCIGKLLGLDCADWLFRSDNGADEDLITAIASMQWSAVDTDMSDVRRVGNHEHQYVDYHIRSQSHRGRDGLVPSQRNHIPSCGKGCVWDGPLLVSFGVWCVHRVLELCLMESRPELWGKYTYVLNRLQGILEPAYLKSRVVPVLCRCVRDLPVPPDGGKHRPSKHGSLRDYGSGDFGNSSVQNFSHPWPWGHSSSGAKGKASSSSMLLEMIREAEAAVGSRKGRTGTAAGDVAFPRGKENLLSALKRYKKKVSTKSPGSTGMGNGRR